MRPQGNGYDIKFSDLIEFGRQKPLDELFNWLRGLFLTQSIRRILVVRKRSQYGLFVKYFCEGLILFDQLTKMN